MLNTKYRKDFYAVTLSNEKYWSVTSVIQNLRKPVDNNKTIASLKISHIFESKQKQQSSWAQWDKDISHGR